MKTTLLALRFSLFVLFFILPTSGWASNFLNMYVLGGGLGTVPKIEGTSAAPGYGGTGGLTFDFRPSDALALELGFFAATKRFELGSRQVTWNSAQFAPLIRFFLVEDLLSIGPAFFFSRRLTSVANTHENEVGGLVSCRLDLNLIPSFISIMGLGLAIEARALAGFYSFGSGASTSSYDAQLLAGIRFGFL